MKNILKSEDLFPNSKEFDIIKKINRFENHEIFPNIDAGERLRPLKSRDSLAGAISMPCGAPTYHLHDS